MVRKKAAVLNAGRKKFWIKIFVHFLLDKLAEQAKLSYSIV